MKVLLVDDDFAVRNSLQKQLEHLGHEAIACADGLAALMALKDNEDIDVILTDYRMPLLGGKEWIELLQHYHPSIPIVIVTAYDFVKEKVEEKDVLFLSKPFSLDDLEGVLKQSQTSDG